MIVVCREKSPHTRSCQNGSFATPSKSSGVSSICGKGQKKLAVSRQKRRERARWRGRKGGAATARSICDIPGVGASSVYAHCQSVGSLAYIRCRCSVLLVCDKWDMLRRIVSFQYHTLVSTHVLRAKPFARGDYSASSNRLAATLTGEVRSPLPTINERSQRLHLHAGPPSRYLF